MYCKITILQLCSVAYFRRKMSCTQFEGTQLYLQIVIQLPLEFALCL